MYAKTTISRDDMIDCMQCGERRTAASVKRRDNWGLINDDPLEDSRRQTVGYIGELAVSRYFGTEMQREVNLFKKPDVIVGNFGIQVKASEWARNLIIRPDAKDHEPYVLVLVEMPQGDPRTWEKTLPKNAKATATIVGWMFPYEARELAREFPDLERDPGRRSPAIFIPREMLHPIRHLRELTQTPKNVYNIEGRRHGSEQSSGQGRRRKGR